MSHANEPPLPRLPLPPRPQKFLENPLGSPSVQRVRPPPPLPLPEGCNPLPLDREDHETKRAKREEKEKEEEEEEEDEDGGQVDRQTDRQTASL